MKHRNIAATLFLLLTTAASAAHAAPPVVKCVAKGPDQDSGVYATEDCQATVKNIDNAYRLLAQIDATKYGAKLAAFEKQVAATTYDQKSLAKLTAGKAAYVAPIVSLIKKDKNNVCGDNGNKFSCLMTGDENGPVVDVNVNNFAEGALVSVNYLAAGNLTQNNFIYKSGTFHPVDPTCALSVDTGKMVAESVCMAGPTTNFLFYKIDVTGGKFDKIKEFGGDPTGEEVDKYAKDSGYDLKNQKLNFYQVD